MKKLNCILLAIVAIIAAACNQTNNSSKTDSNQTIAAKVADTANTIDVFTAYIGLKDQFLKSDVAGIKTSATALAGKLAGIKGCSETAALSQQIAATNDIKLQRAAFLILSKDVVALVKGAKLKMAAIFVDYCPMADSGKGGYWLSLNKEIQNPYFPEHMKECGQVKEQIN